MAYFCCKSVVDISDLPAVHTL